MQSSDRMRAVSGDARDRLRLLDARLDELVARAVEVSVGSADSGTLSGDVDEIVNDLEALRQALEETDRAADGSSVPMPDPSARAESAGPGEPQARTWPPSG